MGADERYLPAMACAVSLRINQLRKFVQTLPKDEQPKFERFISELPFEKEFNSGKSELVNAALMKISEQVIARLTVEANPTERVAEGSPGIQILVSSEEEKEKLLAESQYIHDYRVYIENGSDQDERGDGAILLGPDSDKCGTLMHLYTVPEQIVVRSEGLR